MKGLPDGNPAVDAARSEASTLRSEAERNRVSVGIHQLQKAIELIYYAEQLARDEKRLRRIA
ncbi:MAG UNVERIFIED_CONTAM: hypothetical protein LVR18_05370 [Planctomycetaceae bacterium]